MRARSICPMVGLGRRPGRERRPYARRFETVRASRSASSLTKMLCRLRACSESVVCRVSRPCASPPRTGHSASHGRTMRRRMARRFASACFFFGAYPGWRKAALCRGHVGPSTTIARHSSIKTKKRELQSGGLFHVENVRLQPCTVPVYRGGMQLQPNAFYVRTGRRYTAAHANTTSRSWPWGRFCRTS